MNDHAGDIHQAIHALTMRLKPVGTQAVDWDAAPGRVLAEALHTDRDSPPCGVSAMDGYALRLEDVLRVAEAGDRVALPMGGEVAIGRPPPPLPAGAALRIFTGAAVPAGTDAVIRREDVEELPDQIVLRVGVDTIRIGQSIRPQGENLPAGEVVVPIGTLVTPPVTAALAGFGKARVNVYCPVRVGIITTGDELLPVDASPRPWQIRDSNGPALSALLGRPALVELKEQIHAADRPDQIERALSTLLPQCDAIILTGGVSAGDYDHVPAVVRSTGAEVVFHKLPIRPGRPILGAVGPAGQAIFGLPGNPVSVMVTARRFASLAIARRAGMAEMPIPPMVRVERGDGQTLGLWWYRPVRFTAAGEAELVPGRGSGDVVCAARSDGFIEVPPDTDADGAWPFYSWNM